MAAGLIAGVESLYISSIYSDLTIVCGDQEFKVHKNILHLQSPYFNKMLTGKYMEAKRKTLSRSTTTPLPTWPPFSTTSTTSPTSTPLRTMPSNSTTTIPLQSETENAVSIYATADKHNVPPLRDLAATKLKITFVPTMGKIPAVIATIRLVERSTAEETLWDIIIPKIAEDMGWLVGRR
ncbi:hypothetical protein LTR86_009845 [Recurvomyces mirabilis]|nr:hypothetical protein LTR86_009845 [Recurvomyces mirabilis]